VNIRSGDKYHQTELNVSLLNNDSKHKNSLINKIKRVISEIQTFMAASNQVTRAMLLLSLLKIDKGTEMKFRDENFSQKPIYTEQQKEQPRLIQRMARVNAIFRLDQLVGPTIN
jgi:hypothetical protein